MTRVEMVRFTQDISIPVAWGGSKVISGLYYTCNYVQVELCAEPSIRVEG